MNYRYLLLATSSIVTAFVAGEALAQTAPAASAAVEEVVVTGSRIARAGFQAPTPVTVVGSEQLLAAAPQSIAAAVNTMPSLVTSGGPQSGGGSLAHGRNELNARGLGSQRTLILLNGRRFPASSNENVVDTNQLPAGLVDRVEVVTGGASAAYGSDAVSGVVNFILKRRQDGLDGQVAYGQSQRGDAQDRKVTLNWGRTLMDDRWRILTSFDYYDGEGVASQDRDERLAAIGIISNPAYNAANPNGQTRLIIVPNARSVATYGGMVSAATGGTAAARAQLIGTQFVEGGRPTRYDYGTFASASNQSGGDGVNTNLSREVYRPTTRKNVFLRSTFDVTPDIEIYGELQYSESEATSKIGESFFLGSTGLTINADNAFLPAETRALMQSGGVTSFTLNRFLSETYPYNTTQQFTYRGLFGATGKFKEFTWDLWGQKGGNKLKSRLNNSVINQRIRDASDSVVSNGRIVCRVTLTNAASPCVPFNWAGAGSPSAASLAYITGTGGSNTTMDENFFSGSVNGPIYEGFGAGPISMAAGFDYRTVKTLLIADPLSEAGAFNLGNQVGWGGKYKIGEVFAELDVPLLRDMVLAKSLTLNGAVRRTNYSTSGNVTTWKVGAVYEPVSDVRFRTTYSRDIRAPNLVELFSTGRAASQTVEDPVFNRQRFSGVQVVGGGNPNLDPEIANTFVIGGIYSPSWLRGFDVSADYYNIIVDQAIGNLGFQAIVDRCYAGETNLCSYIIRNSSNVITRVNTITYGLQSLKQHGIDYEVGYRVPGADWFDWWRGNLSLRYVTTNLRSSKNVAQAGTVTENSGAGGLPHWKSTFSVNYDLNDWKGFLQIRRIGEKRKSNQYVEGVDINDNSVPSVTYVDAQLTKKVSDKLDVYLNIQNLLDKAPPVDPATGNWFVPTNENLYDQIRRMYRVGLRFRY